LPDKNIQAWSNSSDPNPVLDQLDQLGAAAALTPQDPDIWRRKQDLITYVQKFLLDSVSWRRTSFEPDWFLYRRNADSIYDPNIIVRKESWQSRVFMPMTASHRENIQAALYKMIVGARPPLEMRRRSPSQDDQSENIRDIILRELEKSRWEVGLNRVLDDATTFGSGFVRIRFECNYEDRFVRSPKYDALRITNPQAIIEAFQGTRKITGYEGKVQNVETYRGVKFEWLSIWDIFCDPKAMGIPGNSVAYRFRMDFNDIIKGVKRGYYYPECVHILRNASSREIEPVDRSIVMADRTISPSYPRRTEYGKKVQCHEFFARLPKKWVMFNNKTEDIDDPEELVPARVLFAGEPDGPAQTLLAVEVNDDYQGEAPIHKMDYLPVADRFYGRGIPEMLKGLQEVTNETCNQRIDNIALTMNRMFGVIEKAVVNRADFVSKPGAFIRLDAKYVQDIRQALMPIEMPDITSSAYKDVQEIERYAQERTSANRVTLGTNGLANDANRTATGLEILRQSAGEKFAYIGMLFEFSFLYDTFRAIWKTIYANVQPRDIIDSLGEERAASFKLLTPEQIEKDYIYEPQGIFTMENKALTQQRLGMLFQQFMQQPWVNPMAFFDKEAKANNLDPTSLKYTPEEMTTMMHANAMAQGQIAPPGAPPVQPQGQQGPQAQPPQDPNAGKSDEQIMDEAAARVAVKKGKITPKEAADRLRTKYG